MTDRQHEVAKDLTALGTTIGQRKPSKRRKQADVGPGRPKETMKAKAIASSKARA